MLPVYIKITCRQAKSPVVKPGRQVSALTSGPWTEGPNLMCTTMFSLNIPSYDS